MSTSSQLLPLIGITAASDPRMPEHYLLRWDYIHSIVAAGGLPVILAPVASMDSDILLERIDALILSGGGDIAPTSYGQTEEVKPVMVDQERDRFELAMISGALQRDLPVLGICRGMQLINIACGGDLIQDIPNQTSSTISHDDPSRPRYTLSHDVTLAPNTLLKRIVGSKNFAVNSFHHQAVNRLGSDLTIGAVSADGLVEGIVLETHRFVVGVQWHPESLCSLGAPFTSLFEALISQATQAHDALH